MSVGMDVYIPLSLVMFLEYAIWGAWAPVLAARLLGPLKMSGKQTGWIYATLPLGCMVSPLIATSNENSSPATASAASSFACCVQTPRSRTKT